MFTFFLIQWCFMTAAPPAALPPPLPKFADPVRLKAGEDYVKMEAPGYAAPCWHDVDGDGRKDLVTGQFKGGKIRIHRNLGDGKFAPGRWLEVNGKVAEVPGVW